MTSLFDNAPMLNSVSLSPMDTMGEVRPPARLKTTIVFPSNPTLRWKRKFFNYLKILTRKLS